MGLLLSFTLHFLVVLVPLIFSIELILAHLFFSHMLYLKSGLGCGGALTSMWLPTNQVIVASVGSWIVKVPAPETLEKLR